MSITGVRLLKRLVLWVVCVTVFYFAWSSSSYGKQDLGKTVGDEFKEDIAKGRGSEVARTAEGLLDKVIGWMPLPLFVALVFGIMIEGLIELLWPSDILAEFAQGIVGGLLGASFSCIFMVPLCLALLMIAIVAAVFWAVLYAILLVPIMLVETVVCIVR